MAFQIGFPKKPNTPHRKIHNKSMGQAVMSGRNGTMDISSVGAVNKKEIDVIQTRKMSAIRGESQDICCK